MIGLSLAFLVSLTTMAWTVDRWFLLAVELQEQSERLDRDDRRFVAHMVNRLALDDATVPTRAQQRWLLDIKRRMDADNKKPRR